MENKKTSFKTCNYSKPTPKKWRRIGDACILTIPLLQGTIQSSPLNADTKAWIITFTGLILVGAKFVTNFFTEE